MSITLLKGEISPIVIAMNSTTDSSSTLRPDRKGSGTVVTLALALMALASVVVAISAVVVAVEVKGRPVGETTDTTSNAALLTALQSLAAGQGAASVAAPAAPDPAEAADPAVEGEGAAPVAPAPVPAPAAAPAAPAVSAAPAATAAPAAPAESAAPTPTADELTATLHVAVDPANDVGYRAGYVERGGEATAVLEQIGARAGTMLQVVRPRVIDPLDVDGNRASGRLQVTFAGAPGPETPLRLTFVYLDGGWKLSARSVCDVASFNGFACPSGYVR